MSASHALLVSPYPWSVPHPATDHLREVAVVLRAAGMQPVVVAPSGQASALLASRRALRALAAGTPVADVLKRTALQQAVGSAIHDTIPVLAVGVPMGRVSVANRLTIRQLLAATNARLVYCVDPTVAGLGRAVSRLSETPVVGAFLDPDVISDGTRTTRALEYVDAAIITGDEVGAALADAGYVGEAITTPPVLAPPVTPTAPAATGHIVIFRAAGDDRGVRAACRRILSEAPGTQIVLASRWRRIRRPRLARSTAGRVQAMRVPDATACAALLAGAQVAILPDDAPTRLQIECDLAGIPHAELHAVVDGGLAAANPAANDRTDSVAAGAAALAALAQRVGHAVHSPGPGARPPRNAPLVTVDLHSHTNHSYDCATDPEALLWAAERAGIDVLAVTDHNEISGALACRELADGYNVQVIVGEEIMTVEGEVIGLFLSERIEPHQTWDATLRAIHEQDALVYVPHPFDRMHTIPAASTLRRTLAQIDVLEVRNGRLAFEAFNDDARRFASRHGLRAGAGSDAHVLQSLGSATVRMPAFDGPEEFLAGLDHAVIGRDDRSYAYVQSLKFLQTRTPFGPRSTSQPDPAAD